MAFKKRMSNRKKTCKICSKELEGLDYKDVNTLKKFMSERGKILPRRVTGTCAKDQRKITLAIKRARAVALLPFVK